MTEQPLMTLEQAIAELRAQGWTLLEPAPEKLPDFAVGQRWVPTKGRAKPRAITRIGACEWYPFAGPVCIFFFSDGDHSTSPKVLHPSHFRSWVRKNDARPEDPRHD